MMIAEDRHHWSRRNLTPAEAAAIIGEEACMRLSDDIAWLLGTLLAEARFHEEEAERLDRLFFTRARVADHQEAAHRLRQIVEGRTPP